MDLFLGSLNRPCLEITDRDSPQRSRRREPTQDLVRRTFYRYPYPGILHSSFCRDAVKEILDMIFYSSPRKLAETNLASLLRVPCNTVCGLLPGQNRKSAFADKNRGMSTTHG